MAHQQYPSDLTDAQWEVLKPLIPAAKPGGRLRTVELREVLNAIFYVVRSGCTWRMVPHDLVPWGTAFDVSYVVGGVAGLTIAVVMLRSGIFGRAPTYVGIVLNALMLVPPTVGTIGLILSFLSLVPLAIWLVLTARKLFQLGKGAAEEETRLHQS